MSRLPSAICARSRCVIAAALLVGASSGTQAAASPSTQPAAGNHLIHASSPYLQQHAHNPVDWYPWGEEAFAKARRENKPIFLSVGYSTCHWCHVMERESFEDPVVAKLLNDSFVSIKVDREERPDVDRVYMMFVQATTGSGGWPMTVFLTPDLKPFFGGTYFPPEPHDDLPGLKPLLARAAQAWKADHDAVAHSADGITASMKAYAAGEAAAATSRPAAGRIAADAQAVTAKRLAAVFDKEHGGFGLAPKFPEPSNLEFLIRYGARTGDAAGARWRSPR